MAFEQCGTSCSGTSSLLDHGIRDRAHGQRAREWLRPKGETEAKPMESELARAMARVVHVEVRHHHHSRGWLGRHR